MAIRPQRRVLAALAGAAAIMLALAGCGDGSSGSGTGYALKPGRPEATTAPDRATDGPTSTENDPLSTFAVDVDTASYTYARRQILSGSLPLSTEVRPEEFINAFDQDYEEPAGDGFTLHSDGSRLPGAHGARIDAGGDLRLMRIGLQTRSESEETRADATLTFVVDVSGSMAEPGRLDLVKDALHTLVDQLRPTDAVAVVAFSGSATVVRPMTRVADRAPLHAAIDTLEASNSTNLDAGLTQGYRTAASRRPSRSRCSVSASAANTATR